MICQRCGTKYDDNTAVCPVCSQQNAQAGAPTVQNNDNQAPQYDYNYQPPPQYEYPEVKSQPQAPAKEENVYYNYGEEFSGTKYNKRKRRKKTASLIISLSVIAILLTVFLLNFNAIVGFSLKTFAKPDVYFAYVEKRATATSVKNVISTYSDIKDKMLDGSATEGKVSINLGSKAKEDLGGGEFDWVEDFYISTTAFADGKNTKTEMLAHVGDTMLMGIEAYVDGEGKTILGLPGLTDKYLLINTQKVDTFSTEEIKELLPQQKTIDEITDRYTKIVKKYVKGTRRATEDILIDGVEEKIVMLELNIGRSEMIDLLEELVSTLKEDEQALEVVWNFSEKLVEKGVLEEGDDLVAEILNVLDGYLKTLEEARTNVAIEIPTFRYRNFVNKNHDVVGKEITVNNKNVLYFLNVQDGKEVGSEIRIAKAVTMIGYGKVEDGKYTIDYTMTNSGAQLGTMSVKDLGFDKKENSFSGSIKILPTARFIYDSNLPTELGKMGAGLDLSFDIGKEGSSFTANLLSDSKLYFGINSYSTTTEVEDVTPPTEKVFNGENESEEFFKTLDFDALYEKLKKAELPEGIISLVQYYQLLQQFAS